MKDVRGTETSVGDFVAIASRAGNIAEFKFGWITEFDGIRFKVAHEGTRKESSWMNWYYHGIAEQNFCKVLNISDAVW